MAQSTVYKRTVGGSIGAGIGSVFSGSGKTYFILEHKTSSKYYRAGETQEIIVDQIELGRDSKCQVRYDDSFTTVSRRHAAIVREGSRWKLVQLSSTNSTLLNGQKISNESYLHNGDEIQLSAGGPKMGFIVPTGNKATVGSIGLTRRLNLFGQQALRPYKQAITTLSVLLVLVIAGSIWWGNIQSGRIAETEAQLTKTKEELVSLLLANKDNQQLVDSLTKELGNINRRIATIRTKPIESKTTTSERGGILPVVPKDTITPGRTTSIEAPGNIAACNPHVYVIILDKIYYETAEGSREEYSDGGIIGSGFMLSDGRFVTARHVVETWYYYKFFREAFYKYMNYAAFNGGKIYAKFTVISPSGKRYSFTNEQIICNRANDRVFSEDLGVYREAVYDRDDWAYFQTDALSGLEFDNALSRSLPQGTRLDILGFPNGMGAEDLHNLKPIYSGCITSLTGLTADGVIITSNDNTESGNSGGPVLTYKDGKYIVVGLVSGGINKKGRVIPINEVR